MKKNIALLAGMAALMHPDNLKIHEQGNVVTSKPERRKPEIPFKKEEGIQKLIKDYQLIKSGKSRKGNLKQNRIIEKVEGYLKNGLLKKEDLMT